MTKKTHLILVFLFLFCGLASAKYSGGSGEPNDPYLIATPNDLNSIGLDPNDWDKHFLMTADINMAGITGTQYNVIGDYPDFNGVFDGNNHTITNFTYGISWSGGSLIRNVDGSEAAVKNVIMVNAEVNEPGDGEVACLVGRLRAGQVSNCHVINGKVNAENFSGLLVGTNESQVINCSASGFCYGMQRMGGLVGETRNQGTVINCYSDANVIVKFGIAGGLVGLHSGDLIIDCYSTGRIEGLDSSGEVGGLVGDNRSVIEQCYSTAEVIGGNDEGIGGLVGLNNETGTVSKCFATGDVSGIIDVGGLVGYNYTGGSVIDSYAHGDVNATCCYAAGLVSGNKGIVQRCYSTGKVVINGSPGDGLVSHHDDANDSFWDIEASDCNSSGAGTGLPTSQMQMLDTFADAGWDMLNVWDIGENQTYPFLRTHLPSDINKDDETNLCDFAILALNWLLEE